MSSADLRAIVERVERAKKDPQANYQTIADRDALLLFLGRVAAWHGAGGCAALCRATRGSGYRHADNCPAPILEGLAERESR